MHSERRPNHREVFKITTTSLALLQHDNGYLYQAYGFVRQVAEVSDTEFGKNELRKFKDNHRKQHRKCPNKTFVSDQVANILDKFVMVESVVDTNHTTSVPGPSGSETMAQQQEGMGEVREEMVIHFGGSKTVEIELAGNVQRTITSNKHREVPARNLNARPGNQKGGRHRNQAPTQAPRVRGGFNTGYKRPQGEIGTRNPPNKKYTMVRFSRHWKTNQS